MQISLKHFVPILLVACGGGGTKPDARDIPDGSADGGGGPGYHHTITLDGTDDFAAADQFDTTSASYVARVSWDDAFIYIGYGGADLAPTTTDATTKWLFVYLDTRSGGVGESEQYNSQKATFPSGFTADYYLRYRCDGMLASVQEYVNGAWTDTGQIPATAQAGTFLELALPTLAIGAGGQLSLVTWMINEKAFAESSYAGLYANNFSDGYAANLALGAYLHVDFSSPAAPNDPANRRP